MALGKYRRPAISGNFADNLPVPIKCPTWPAPTPHCKGSTKKYDNPRAVSQTGSMPDSPPARRRRLKARSNSPARSECQTIRLQITQIQEYTSCVHLRNLRQDSARPNLAVNNRRRFSNQIRDNCILARSLTRMQPPARSRVTFVTFLKFSAISEHDNCRNQTRTSQWHCHGRTKPRLKTPSAGRPTRFCAQRRKDAKHVSFASLLLCVFARYKSAPAI
jgi:hypothetical protein